MGKGRPVSLSFIACQSKLGSDIMHRKKQDFNESWLVNAIGGHKGRVKRLTANLSQAAF